MKLSLVGAFLLISAGVNQAVAQDRSARSLALTDVQIVDVELGQVVPRQTVVISGDRIESVGHVEDVPVPSEAMVIDGSGRYLIPGLWDMHVHGTRWESTYPLYLANGVTGVREMFGPSDAGAFHSALAARQLAAPRMYLASPILDGSPPIRPRSVVVTTVEEARRAVIDQKERGVDFIKVYERLPRDAYFAILAESARQGLAVAGHVPGSVTPWEAAAAGQKTVEHLSKIPLACSSEETRLRAQVVRSYLEHLRQRVEASRSFNPARCQLLYAAFVRNDVWMVPTLAGSRASGWSNDPQFTDDDRLRYFDAETRAWLAPSAEGSFGERWTEDD